MKGLILSGGKGTRLRPLTYTRAKQLIPIANKPNLFYVVEDLVAAGITDVGVIISPETGDEIRGALGSGANWGARFTFVVQDEPKGLAHAVKTAREYLGDEAFVMYLGDNLLSGGIAHLVAEYERGGSDSIVLLTPVDNPSQFGVAELDGQGKVVRLVEKPADPPSNLALVGVYLFGPVVHEVIAELQPSRRGEYEITDAIQGLIDRGLEVTAHQVRGWWKDTGKPEDLLEANRLVLGQISRDIRGELVDADVTGEVVVEAGARIVRSEIRGPAHIAAGASVEDAYVGPYTCIGPGARILASQVEYSIVLNDAELRHLPSRVDASVIGQGVVVDGGDDGPRPNTLQFVLGDNSQVKL
ncbi:MAG: glucose-1-phosphate thymidylyltransferase [Planctomycetota bacterium]|jgi:glucose-1-phosphate thymidylyltransferase